MQEKASKASTYMQARAHLYEKPYAKFEPQLHLVMFCFRSSTPLSFSPTNYLRRARESARDYLLGIIHIPSPLIRVGYLSSHCTLLSASTDNVCKYVYYPIRVGYIGTFPVHYNHTYHMISFIHAASSLHPFLGRLKSFPRPRATASGPHHLSYHR
jgi:hypothetical protein